MVGPTKAEIWDNIKNSEPNDMLKMSVKSDIIEGVKLALKNGDNNIDYNLGVLLRIAADNGNIEMVKFLMNNGLRNELSVGNYMILLNSVRSGNIEMVKYIMKLSTKNGIDYHLLGMIRLAEGNGYKDILDYLNDYKNTKYLRIL